MFRNYKKTKKKKKKMKMRAIREINLAFNFLKIFFSFTLETLIY